MPRPFLLPIPAPEKAAERGQTVERVICAAEKQNPLERNQGAFRRQVLFRGKRGDGASMISAISADSFIQGVSPSENMHKAIDSGQGRKKAPPEGSYGGAP